MSFPRYPEYKDSGVAWLGEVPAHWLVTPIKRFGRLKGGAGFPHERQGVEGEELDFHKVNALGSADAKGMLLPSENTISLDTAKTLGAFVFPSGTIVFAKVGAALLLGRIRELASPACIDNNMMGLVVGDPSICVRFLRYAMSLVRFDLISNPGAVPSLNEGQIGNFALVCPPSSEQVSIAEFLDAETQKIDGLIYEQEKLIALLKEKRQAVISHAVTKGLDPNVPMKDSGIEWLGEVPAHWRIKRISWLFSLISSGTTPPSESERYYEGDVCWVTTGELRETLIVDTEKKISQSALEELSALRLYPAGTLLIALYGATIGRLGFLGVEAATNQACCAMAGPIGVMPRFVFYALMAAKDYLLLIASGGGQPNINQEKVRSLRIGVPSLAEQEEVVEMLDRATQAIDLLIEEAGRAIMLLGERRSAIISAAVTGKIDVRQLMVAEVA